MQPPSACPICSAASPRLRGEHKDEGTTYTLYACDSCGAEFWWPLKNPGPEWYSRNEAYGGRNSDPIWAANWNQKKILSFLAPLQGRVLDVGCGIGNFLALAKERGWQCAGVDFDPDAIAVAKKKTGLQELYASDVVSYAQSNPERFDLITFFDVLEHIDNHNEFLRVVHGLLKDNGHIAMSMPYRKHAEWLMPGDLPPRHLTRWDRRSLRRLLGDRGFDVVYMTRRSEGIWNIVMMLRARFGKRLSFGAVRAVRKKVGDVNVSTVKRPFIVRVVQLIAKIKDALIFGLPALILWIVMLPLPSRYPTLYTIARKRP